MSQMTWRADEELIERVKSVAGAEGRSMNEYVTFVLDVATNPELAGSDAERIRERLRRAGLLAEPAVDASERPSATEIERASLSMRGGALLSDLVSEMR